MTRYIGGTSAANSSFPEFDFSAATYSINSNGSEFTAAINNSGEVTIYTFGGISSGEFGAPDSTGRPTTGTFGSIRITEPGGVEGPLLVFFNMDVATFFSFADAGNGAGFAAAIFSGTDSVNGGTGDDTLYGYDGDDALYGYEGTDSLIGGAGDDYLNGGLDSDTMIGGVGDDEYYFSTGDVIIELADEGNDELHSIDTTINLNDFANIEDLYFETNDSAHGIGTAAANVIIGGAGADILEGRDGNDTINGGPGVDTLVGGSGDDTYVLTNSASDQIIEEENGGIDLIQTRLSSFTLAAFANVENLRVNPNASGTSVTGNGLNNYIYIFPDYYNTDDTIDGGAGADTMWAAGGNDVYVVDNVNDVINEFGGNDTIWTTLSNVSLASYTGIENLSYIGTGNFVGVGNSVANALAGAAGNDSLEGGGASDTLNGGSGADTLVGGDGDDTYVVDNLNDVIIEDSSGDVDTVQATINVYSLAAIDNVENLRFTGSGGFAGTGNALANTITGGSLADTLNGGAGADTLIGGAGNDTYVVDALDSITEGAGAGTDTIQTALNTYTIAALANVENLTFIGAGDFSGVGNAVTNTLTGSSGNDTLNGAAGADALIGGAGNDVYIVDTASDVVTEAASAGTDTIQTALTTFSIASINNVENLTYTGSAVSNMTGNALANYITGGSNNDFLNGGDGNDTFDGGAGNDSLTGGLGDDTFIVVTGDIVSELSGGGTDTIQTTSSSYSLSPTTYVENLTFTGSGNFAGTGNESNNVITGGAGNDVLYGLGGNDTLNGGSGNDTLYGGRLAADWLYGGEGDDWLDGGDGGEFLGSSEADRLTGGAGNDTYVVRYQWQNVFETANEGLDTILTGISTVQLDNFQNVENLTYLGTGNFFGSGNSLTNIITGGNGADTLGGGLGGDTLIGGAGDDYYSLDIGGNAAVVEEVDGGVDTILAWATYSLVGLSNIENLDGWDGGQGFTGYGNDLNNRIRGWNGDDYLDGGLGADTLMGNGGNNTYIVDNVGDVVDTLSINFPSGRDTVLTSLNIYTMPNGVDVLTFTGAGNFSGTGNALYNIITGGAGNDVLNGGLAADTLIGGDGNDTYIVDDVGDVTIEASALGGTDLVQSSVTYTLGLNLEHLTLTGGAAINGFGNALDNALTGNTAANTLDGGLGADTMIGGAGNDTYFIDNAGDIVSEDSSAGTDLVRTSLLEYTLTNNFENLTYIGVGNFSGFGNSSGNLISSGGGNDLLDGGAGADTLTGGVGNDVYVVDSAADVVTESPNAGTDSIRTTLNAYSLAPLTNVESLSFTGFGDFNGFGNASANALSGGAGNDTLDGGSGADALSGGTGDDVYIVDNAADVITEGANAGTDIIRTTLNSYSLASLSNIENLTFIGSGNFNGSGNALDNVLSGAAGNDTLDGGVGADTLTGGVGNDVYVVDSAADVVTESANAGTDSIRTTLNAYSLAPLTNVESLSFTGFGDFNGFGNASANALSGGAGNDTLDGGSGADVLAGGAGDDVYVVDNAADIVTETANSGTDRVESTSNTYSLAAYSNVENLSFIGSGNFNGSGNASVNVLVGGTGNDTLDGGAGADSLNGGSGDDVYVVDNVADVVTEDANAGTDIIRTSLNSYSLASLRNVENLSYIGSGNFNGAGNALDNSLSSGTGNDTLDGGAGADSLNGGDGADTLTGGAGNDTILGGGGEDTAVFSAAYSNYQIVRVSAGAYTITDLRTGVTDGIDTLSGVERVRFSDQTISLSDAALVSANFTVNAGETYSALPAFELQGATPYTFRNDGEISSAGSTNAGAVLTAIVSQNPNVRVENNGAVNITALGGGARSISGTIGQIVNTGAISAHGVDYATTVYGNNDVALTNAAGGTLSATASNGNAIGADFVNWAHVENDGLIEATTTFGYAWGVRFGRFDNGYLENTGTITAAAGGGYSSIGVDANSLSTQTANAPNIVNSGTITADLAIYGGDGVEYIVNTGTLDGDVDLVGGNDRLINSSLIDGRVYMGGDNDFLDNRLGTITGAIYLGGGNDEFLGSGGAESVNAGTGNDTLSGGGGADTLIGGAGDDTYIVDTASVSITELGGEGADIVRSSAATFTLALNLENLVLLGAAVSGTGNAGSNVITGNSSANVLRGLGGADTLDGGAGFDLVSYDLATGAVTANLQTGIASGDGNDTLISIESLAGSDFGDTLTGDAAANSLSGLAGADTLDGGGGADTLIGGGGDDTYIVGAAGVTIIELALGGTDTVRTSLAAYTLNTEVENLVLTSAAAATGTGNAANNVITGNAFANTLKGMAGDDTLDGGAGADAVSYSNANGSVTVSLAIAGAQVIGADQGSDTLIAIENLTGSAYEDSLTGNASANSINAWTGNDTLDGGAGADTLAGGAGNDLYIVDSLGDVVTELANEGVDAIHTELNAYTLTAANVENLTYIGGGNVSLTGSAVANVLTGGSGNDEFRTGGGMDTLIGGDGDDLYVISQAGVVITELSSEGVDTVRTSLTAYTLDSNVENLALAAAAAANGFGNAENNRITGNAFANTLKGFGGDDTLDGGAGADTVSYDRAAGGVNANLSTNSATGDGVDVLIAIENLTGSDFDDVLTGNSLANALSGGGGNDSLDGGAGMDTLAGGEGNDEYIAEAFDVIVEAAGGGTDSIRTAANVYVLAANVENVTFEGVGAFTGAGNALANVITGGDGNDTLNGAGGADTLIGGDGNDLYVIGNAGVVVTELTGDGTDTVRTSLASYTLDAEVENLLLVTTAVNGAGNGLNNLLTGNTNVNTLRGFGGADTLNGGGGADTLVGGAGDDVYFVDNTGVVVTELSGEGAEEVRTTLSAYTLDANVENLTLLGAALNGFGNAENNVITGNANANVLKGFGGDDTLDGGLGNDTVSYSAANAGIAVTLAALGMQTIGADQGDDYLVSIENVTGSNFSDGLTGNGAANVLNGGLGNDTLDGGAGADTLAGGAGDDVYVVDALDVITEAAGGGTDTIRTTLSTYVLTAANLENLVFTGAGAATLTGNASANVLTGGTGADTFRSGGGMDTLIGGGGDDLYVITEAGVVVTELSGQGTDTVRTSLTVYTLGENIENLVLVSTALNGFGNAENNVITGNDNANTLKGFLGDDTLDGAGGADAASYSSALGGVVVDLVAGTATGDGNDTLISMENVTGSAFNDSLTGNGSANSINAWTGNDTLSGGLGADTLTGGAGADVFVFNTATGAGNIDSITDFAVADDGIELALSIFTTLGATGGVLNATEFRIGAMALDADDHIIYNSATGALFYDSNGNGVGGSVQIATLSTGLLLTSADFMVS